MAGQIGTIADVNSDNRRRFALLKGYGNSPALLQGIVEGPGQLGNQWEGRDSTIARG